MLRTRGAHYSAILHLLLLLLMIFGLPDFFHRPMDAEPEAISVDILPISPVSNVKPQQKATKPPTPQPDQEETAVKAHPATHQEKPEPEETPEHVSPKEVVKPKPEETAKPEPKPEPKPVPKPEEKPKPKPKPKPKQENDPLNDILNGVATEAAKESPKPTHKSVQNAGKTDVKSTQYDASQPMSLSEKDGIRNQIESHWNVPAGAKDAGSLIVTLRLELSQNGTVTKVELARDTGRYNSDSYFQAAVDSAIRAVRQSSPLKGLPPEKYGTWHDIEMNFNPKDLL